MYSREVVELLVPAIWDEREVLEVRAETAPDPDMPKTPSADPRRSTDRVTMCADIQRAWRLAPLSLGERQAVFSRYYVNISPEAASYWLQADPKTIRHRSLRGIDKLGEFLNGTPYGEEEE